MEGHLISLEILYKVIKVGVSAYACKVWVTLSTKEFTDKDVSINS